MKFVSFFFIHVVIKVFMRKCTSRIWVFLVFRPPLSIYLYLVSFVLSLRLPTLKWNEAITPAYSSYSWWKQPLHCAAVVWYSPLGPVQSSLYFYALMFYCYDFYCFDVLLLRCCIFIHFYFFEFFFLDFLFKNFFTFTSFMLSFLLCVFRLCFSSKCFVPK